MVVSELYMFAVPLSGFQMRKLIPRWARKLYKITEHLSAFKTYALSCDSMAMPLIRPFPHPGTHGKY